MRLEQPFFRGHTAQLEDATFDLMAACVGIVVLHQSCVGCFLPLHLHASPHQGLAGDPVSLVRLEGPERRARSEYDDHSCQPAGVAMA